MDRLIKIKNSKKILFTPGPASLIKENVFNINPAFGRGDPQYLKMQNTMNIPDTDANRCNGFMYVNAADRPNILSSRCIHIQSIKQ